jgi:serine/threonine-protein kinase
MKKILVIEDDPLILANILELLAEEGFRGLGAPDGRAGVGLALAEEPDLIICDIMMPDLDGFGVLEWLRRYPRLARVPFIFLTARASRRDLRAGMEVGADDYITKPFMRVELLAAIRGRLRRLDALTVSLPDGDGDAAAGNSTVAVHDEAGKPDPPPPAAADPRGEIAPPSSTQGRGWEIEPSAMVDTLIGETLDQKYRIVRVIGEGGMGSVFEAEDTTTLERVAVKLLKTAGLRGGDEARTRFRREVQAASAVDSPHIVRIRDAGTDEATRTLYMVMDHLAGEDLQSLVDRVGPLPPGVALRVAGQALVGLQRAHEAGIVHRDIKPANLFLARQEGGEVRVTILDFGIAKIRADPAATAPVSSLTQTGSFLGSPLYMSPEQVQSSRNVDRRTDLWSLGVALYCSLAGRAPHQDAEFVANLIIAICGAPTPPVQERAPWVRPEIAEVVHRALAIDPEQRWPSAAAMLEAILLLTPEGLALREEMLVGIGAEERALR